MARRRGNLTGRRNANRFRERRRNESLEERSARQRQVRQQIANARSQEQAEQRAVRLETLRLDAEHRRSLISSQNRQIQQVQDRQRHARIRINMRRQSNKIGCSQTIDEFNENLFINMKHNLEIVSIFDNPMCPHCEAYLWKEETKSFCCKNGKIKLKYDSTVYKSGAMPPEPDEAIKSLFLEKFFLERARNYNNALSMSSIGMTEVKPPGPWNPGFKVQGKIHHYISDILPAGQNNKPKFLQLYFHDPENESINRTTHPSNRELDINYLEKAQNCLHRINPYINQIKTHYEDFQNSASQQELQLILTADRTICPNNLHKGTLNMPMNTEIAVIQKGINPSSKLDVMIKLRGGSIRRIDSMHPSYDPLSYTLLFPEGTDGYHDQLRKPTNGRSKITNLEFYRYRFQVRNVNNNFNLLLRAGKLSQQYQCDMYAKIEAQRLNWYKINQKTVKADKYRCVVDAISNDEETIPGRRTILPPTMYMSPRWYAKQFQDAMAIVREYGKPTYFITFTCNPRWSEITNSLLPYQKAEDRPDIVSRVFNLKWESLLTDILKKDILGHCDAYVATKENQKKHLPHAHCLFTMTPADQPKTPEDINKVISAEIPAITNKELHNAVIKHMIHGPCGYENPDCPCMENGKCTKNYPKELRDSTSLSKNSYHHYRRREPNSAPGPVITKIKHGEYMTVDNQWVVPYNPYLLLRYDAHINVEAVGSVEAVKYLYKYIHKGPDRIMVAVGENKEERNIAADEIQRFEVGRYMSASEACWRVFEYNVQKKSPNVEVLQIHLENEQQIIFNNDGEAQRLIENGAPATTLTVFFKIMSENPTMRHIRYPDIFKYCTWNKNTKSFKIRKNQRGCPNSARDIRRETLNSDATTSQKSNSIGRMPMINYNAQSSELYFLRMLLHVVPGPTSFLDLKKLDSGEIKASYSEACIARGLCDNDEEIDKVIEEASSVTFGPQLRKLFTDILMYVLRNQYLRFWNKHKKALCMDQMLQENISEINESVENQALLEIQEKLERNGYDMVKHFNLPQPNHQQIQERIPAEVRFHTTHDIENLKNYIQQKNTYLPKNKTKL